MSLPTLLEVAVPFFKAPRESTFKYVQKFNAAGALLTTKAQVRMYYDHYAGGWCVVADMPGIHDELLRFYFEACLNFNQPERENT